MWGPWGGATSFVYFGYNRYKVAITRCVLLLMAALAKLIDADRRRRRDALSCAPMRAALCADSVPASQCQRSAACVRRHGTRTTALRRSSALERWIRCVHLSCVRGRVHRLHHGCASAHPRWRHLCSPSPQVVDEALWIHHCPFETASSRRTSSITTMMGE